MADQFKPGSRFWCTPATSRCAPLLQTNYKTASKLRHSRNREDILRSSVLIADFFAQGAQKHTQRVLQLYVYTYSCTAGLAKNHPPRARSWHLACRWSQDKVSISPQTSGQYLRILLWIFSEIVSVAIFLFCLLISISGRPKEEAMAKQNQHTTQFIWQNTTINAYKRWVRIDVEGVVVLVCQKKNN